MSLPATLRKSFSEFSDSRFIDESDAELVDVPVALLPSGGEDKKTVDAVHAALEKKNPGKNFIKYYTEQVHGFAAARGNVSLLQRSIH